MKALLSRLAAPLVVPIALSAAGCGLDHIDVTATADAVVPAATPLDAVLGAVPFPGLSQIDFSESLANQGVSKSDVDEVRVKAFTLEVTAPAAGTLDFLDSIAFYAETEGRPRVRIAQKSPVPRGARVLFLETDAVDLTPYVTAPRMTITGEVEGERPREQTSIHAAVVLDVDVNVTGS